MFIPGQALPREVVQYTLQILQNDEVKSEISKQVRIEIDNQRGKSSSFGGTLQSYDSLTSGNVNMQAKMAASGYDVYGRTILKSNFNASNNNTYKKMKNKIKYGKSPENGFINHGQFSMR